MNISTWSCYTSGDFQGLTLELAQVPVDGPMLQECPCTSALCHLQTCWGCPPSGQRWGYEINTPGPRTISRDTPCPWCPSELSHWHPLEVPVQPTPCPSVLHHPIPPQFREKDALWVHIKGFPEAPINESAALPWSSGGVSPSERATGWVGDCSWCWRSQERSPEPSPELAKPCSRSRPFCCCPCQNRIPLFCQDEPRASGLLRQSCQGEKWSGKGCIACSQNIWDFHQFHELQTTSFSYGIQRTPVRYSDNEWRQISGFFSRQESFRVSSYREWPASCCFIL